MASNRSSQLEIKVLQNGFPIAETTKYVRKWLKVNLSNSDKADLSLPFYPLPFDSNLFSYSKGSLKLRIDHHWGGFIVLSDKLESLESKSRDDRFFNLKLNDYGAITHKDLKVLFRIIDSKKVKKLQVKKTKKYFSNPFTLFFHNKSEVVWFLLAALVATIILGLLYIFINSTKLNRPQTFVELDQKYSLPFIDPHKLKNSPEALQFDLNRDNYVGSAADYYHQLTDVMFDWETEGDYKLISEPIKEYYRAIHKQKKDQYYDLQVMQEKIDQQQLSKQATGVLKIPTIVGESIDSKFIWIFDKFDLMQDSFSTTVEQRRKVSLDFISDEPYDWGHFSGGADAEKRRRLEYLSKIRVFQQLNNEQMMYKEATDLANLTSLLNHKIYKGMEQNFLKREDINPVYIDRVSPYASFILNAENFSLEDRINQIQASKWGSQKNGGNYREPLIGEVDTNLIKKTIDKNQFQLQLCYELTLRNKEVQPITMDWQWRIDTRGKILDLMLISSTLEDKKLTDCIYRKMERWTFPRPRKGSIEITHTFKFIPRKE